MEAKKLTGVQLISIERQRQIEVEGFDATHDAAYSTSKHNSEKLAWAAYCYVDPENSRFVGAPTRWPFNLKWWKPSPDNRVNELIKAGALIAAEIDRIQASE